MLQTKRHVFNVLVKLVDLQQFSEDSKRKRKRLEFCSMGIADNLADYAEFANYFVYSETTNFRL